jgi:plastocyanin
MNATRILLIGVVLAAVLAACSGGGSAASASAPADAEVTVVAQEGAFDTGTITVPAGAPFELFFQNLDGMPHNVAIYTDASASEPIFVGETITDAAVLYEVPAIEAGEYFFRCDLHPDMAGTLVAEG